MGLSYDQMREMTMWEFQQRVVAHGKREAGEWHKIRVLATMLLQPHVKKGKRLRPEDLIPLPDDVKTARTMDADIVQSDITKKEKIIKRRWRLQN